MIVTSAAGARPSPATNSHSAGGGGGGTGSSETEVYGQSTGDDQGTGPYTAGIQRVVHSGDGDSTATVGQLVTALLEMVLRFTNVDYIRICLQLAI